MNKATTTIYEYLICEDAIIKNVYEATEPNTRCYRLGPKNNYHFVPNEYLEVLKRNRIYSFTDDFPKYRKMLLTTTRQESLLQELN